MIDEKSKRDEVLVAVNQDGQALRFASKELRGDKEIVLAAVRQNAYAIHYASRKLQVDRDFILEAVRQNEQVFQCVSFDGEALQRDGVKLETADQDREIAFEAVSRDGSLLSCATEELQQDKEIVLAAVRQNGSALQYAGRSLQRDREVVLAAVRQDERALRFADKELRDDKELQEEAIATMARSMAALVEAKTLENMTLSELEKMKISNDAVIAINNEKMRTSRREERQKQALIRRLLAQQKRLQSQKATIESLQKRSRSKKEEL